jgi:hypothetical protein
LSKGITPIYDGLEENLIPFLTKLDLRCHHEGWSSATFITIAGKRYDLTTQFALISETEMQEATKPRWSSPDIDCRVS